jgi:hypothetical protein
VVRTHVEKARQPDDPPIPTPVSVDGPPSERLTGSRMSYTSRHCGPGAVVAWSVRWLNLVAGSGQMRCLSPSTVVCFC